MALELAELTLETLNELDPRIELLVKKHLRHIAADCMARPTEKNKRRLMLEFFVEPVLDHETGDCVEVKLQIKAKSKVPDFQTREFPMRVDRDGFQFNRQIPEDLDQPSLFENGREG